MQHANFFTPGKLIGSFIVSLWGKRRRLTVQSLFRCARAFVVVSLLVSGLLACSNEDTRKEAREPRRMKSMSQKELEEQAAREIPKMKARIRELKQLEQADAARHDANMSHLRSMGHDGSSDDAHYRIMHDVQVPGKRCWWITTREGAQIERCER
jgi:hypothetical protein